MKTLETNSKDPKEFYEHADPHEVNICKHFFERISQTRVMCKKCNLGFFDNPFDPFPIDEINRSVINEQARNNYRKRKRKVVENQ